MTNAFVNLGAGARPTLEFGLDRMPHEQLRLAVKRFDPTARASKIAEQKKAVREVLRDRDKLAAVVARLSELERFLLLEMRRAGGVASGWDLILAAAARGFTPPGGEPFRLYNRTLRDRPGPRFLWSLLRDGLLLPASDVNSWVLDSGYWALSDDDLSAEVNDYVFADERLLALLEEGQAPAPPAPLAVATARLDLPARAPVTFLLEQTELFARLHAAGPLPITQSGSVNRAAVRRLLKGSPLSEEDFDLHLALLGSLGLVGRDGQTLTTNRPGWAQWSALSLPQRLGALTRLYLALPAESETGGRQVTSVGAARRALLSGLALLPGPTEREVFLTAMYDRLGRFVTFERYMVIALSGKRPAAEPPMPEWFRAALAPGALPARLGLVRVREEGTKTYVAPGPALALERGAPAPAAPGPAWLVQPNFELLVYLDQLTPEAVALLGAAEALRWDAQTAVYRLSRDSVYRALEGGQDVQGLIGGLERFSAVPLTNALKATLHDWAARRERLSLTQNARLLEYPSAAARDEALARAGAKLGRPVGERFVLLSNRAPVPKDTARVAYDEPPAKALRFAPDGRFAVEGGDLVLRGLLARVSLESGALRAFDPAGVAKVGKSLLPSLEARAHNPIPPHTRLLLALWTGASPAPALAEVSLLQHPDAPALAAHPQLRGFVEGPLGPNVLIVKKGKQAGLRAALEALNAAPSGELQLGAGLLAGGAAQVGGSEIQHGLDTRKVRAIIEGAIERGALVQLIYREERVDQWSYARTMGRQRKALLKPVRVYRVGSTPYVEVEDPQDGEHETIRVGYITGIGVAPAFG